MSYYPFASSRAAAILHHRKQVAEAMWGRLVTCGGLLIRLPLVGELFRGHYASEAKRTKSRETR